MITWAFMEACGTALSGLSPQSPWGTDVPPAAPYWQCATGLPCWLPLYNWFQVAENHHQLPPHSQCQGHQHPHQNYMAVPLIQPESNDTETRRRGSDCRLDITPKEHPCWWQKEGRPLVRLSSRIAIREAFRKDSDLIQATRQVYFKMH